MDVVVAILPIVITLGLLATKLPGWVAPLVGTVSAAALALLWFDATWGELGTAWNETFWTLVKVVAIIGGGVVLSRAMDRTGAQRKLADWLSAGGPTVPAALLMAHGVVPFLETVTGFGVSVLIGLPLLLSFGFTPYRAAVLTLVGLMIGPWGSMGPGTLLGADIARVSLTDLGLASGVVNLVPFILSGIAAAVISLRGRHEAGLCGSPNADGTVTKPGLGALVRWSLVGTASGVVLFIFVMASNFFLGTPVAGATATLIMSVLWLLYIRKGTLRPGPGRSLVPYLLLLLGTIAGQFVARSFELGAVGEILSSPALWSTSAALIGLWILPIAKNDLQRLPRESALMWWQVATPTALYVLLGVMIAGGGLAEVIAGSLAALGPVYLFLTPFVAGLSGYITASGTGANAMFGATQMAAANALNVSPLWMMAFQNSAAGWSIISSPARIELATALAAPYQRADTPGRAVSRGALLMGTLPWVLIALVIWGVAAVIFLPGTA